MRERAREGKKKEEEEKLNTRKKIPAKRNGRKKEPEKNLEGSPMQALMRKWVTKKEVVEPDKEDKLTVVVENKVESIEHKRVTKDDSIPEKKRGVKDMMDRFEKRVEDPDIYAEWKKKKLTSQVKRKAEQVDSVEEKELVMAEQPKRLKNVSIQQRGISKNEKLSNLNCSSNEVGGQVQRKGVVGGGSGDSSTNGAVTDEQRVWVGVRQNLSHMT